VLINTRKKMTGGGGKKKGGKKSFNTRATYFSHAHFEKKGRAGPWWLSIGCHGRQTPKGAYTWEELIDLEKT